VGLFSAALNLSNHYLSEWIAAHVGYDLRNRLYDHIQHLSFSYHDHAQSGQLISRCIEDVRAIERFAGGSVAELIRFIVLTFGILFIMLTDNARRCRTNGSAGGGDRRRQNDHRQTAGTLP
jgi:ATP-binding cassette subfamily B protein